MADERRSGEDRRKRQLTYEEYCELHGIEYRKARLRWPKQVSLKPTPTVDDLPGSRAREAQR